jgi:hypothetical protein
MSDIILHQYDLSPFSEKIRLALGHKELAWRSVKGEPVPPHPLLDTLTGGYRCLPVLQLSPIVTAWMDRIARVGHGNSVAMTAEEAIDVAKRAEPAAGELVAAGDPSGIAPGTRVTVTPDDNARIPVEGKLVAADAQGIVIRRESAATGPIHVHFPRAGFETIPVV